MTVHLQDGELRIRNRLLPALEHVLAAARGVRADDLHRALDALDVLADVDRADPAHVGVDRGHGGLSHHVRPPVNTGLGHFAAHAVALGALRPGAHAGTLHLVDPARGIGWRHRRAGY